MDCLDIWDSEKTRKAKTVGDDLLEALWSVGLDVIDDVSLVGGCEHRPNMSISLGKISIEDAEGVVRRLEKIAHIVSEDERRFERKLMKTEEKLAKLQD